MSAQIEIQAVPKLPADKAVDEFLKSFPLLPRNYELYRAALAYMFQQGCIEGSGLMAKELIAALEDAAHEFETKPS